jgi:hypothetical protein
MDMNSYRARWSIVLTATALGCASPSADYEPGVTIAERRNVAVRPQLLRCGDYQEPPRILWAQTERVTVPVLVGADGRVMEVGTPRRTTSPADLDRRLSDSLRHEAQTLAEECEFDPALLTGPVRHAVSFRLPY